MKIKLALAIPLLLLAPASAAPTKSAPKTTATRAIGKWRYHSAADRMRGTVTRFAELDSRNSLRFGFPYHGGRATLTLRDRAQDGLNVLLSVQGQFLCNSFSDSSVAVKFDNGPVENYDCSEPDSGTTGLIFIEDADKFVMRLKSARTVIIEANFFQEGPKQMEFDAAGLTWKQETKETAAPVQPASAAVEAPATPVSTTPVSLISTQVLPPYPTISQRLGEQGTTMLRVRIDAAGDCVSAEVVTSSGSNRLDQAAVDFVKSRYKWRPNPGLGQSTATTTVPIVWSLTNAAP